MDSPTATTGSELYMKCTTCKKSLPAQDFPSPSGKTCGRCLAKRKLKKNAPPIAPGHKHCSTCNRARNNSHYTESEKTCDSCLIRTRDTKKRRSEVQVPGKRYCSSGKYCPEGDFDGLGTATCRVHLEKKRTMNRVNRQTEAELAEFIEADCTEFIEADLVQPNAAEASAQLLGDPFVPSNSTGSMNDISFYEINQSINDGMIDGLIREGGGQTPEVLEQTPEGGGQLEDDSVDAAAEGLAALDLKDVCGQVTAGKPLARSTQQQLPNGTDIRVHGLTMKPQFNDRVGRIEGWHAVKERYRIRLEKEETVMLLRPTNIALVVGTRVYLSELQDRTELNGSLASVHSYVTETGHYQVSVSFQSRLSFKPMYLVVPLRNLVLCEEREEEVSRMGEDNNPDINDEYYRQMWTKKSKNQQKEELFDSWRESLPNCERTAEWLQDLNQTDGLLQMWQARVAMDRLQYSKYLAPGTFIERADSNLEAHYECMLTLTKGSTAQDHKCVEMLQSLYNRACDWNDKGKMRRAKAVALRYIEQYEKSKFLRSVVEFAEIFHTQKTTLVESRT